VLDGDGALRPTDVRQQVGDRRPFRQRHGVAVRGDGDAQGFDAAATLAAAFFWAL
jgi:hypothetical protein